MQKTENYGLNKPESTDFYNVDDFNSNFDVLDAKMKEVEETGSKSSTSIEQHIESKSNPHKVTKEQIGLGNVPNVSTNNQTPTYAVPDIESELVSGEKMSVAFGKIAKAIKSLISHLANKSNPHSVTKAQVGLGNCDNTSDVNKPISTATQQAIDTLNSGLVGVIKESVAMTKGGMLQPDGNLFINCEGYSDWITNILNNIQSLFITNNGSVGWVDPTRDVNAFYTGIGLFPVGKPNLPSDDGWYMVISGGVDGTTCQIAVNLFLGTIYWRYCASSVWSGWMSPHIERQELPVGSYILHWNQENLGLPIGYGTWECKGYVSLSVSGGSTYAPYLWVRTA